METMWRFEHSEPCSVSREVAWRFWTDVTNWPVVDSSVESVQLNGAFAAGTTGTTKPRGLDPIEWHILEAQEGQRAVIEIPAPGAVLRCVWQFADLPNGGVQITQQASLEGEQAAAYAQTIGPELANGIPQAMRRMVEVILKAAGEQA